MSVSHPPETNNVQFAWLHEGSAARIGGAFAQASYGGNVSSGIQLDGLILGSESALLADTPELDALIIGVEFALSFRMLE